MNYIQYVLYVIDVFLLVLAVESVLIIGAS